MDLEAIAAFNKHFDNVNQLQPSLPTEETVVAEQTAVVSIAPVEELTSVALEQQPITPTPPSPPAASSRQASKKRSADVLEDGSHRSPPKRQHVEHDAEPVIILDEDQQEQMSSTQEHLQGQPQLSHGEPHANLHQPAEVSQDFNTQPDTVNISDVFDGSNRQDFFVDESELQEGEYAHSDFATDMAVQGMHDAGQGMVDPSQEVPYRSMFLDTNMWDPTHQMRTQSLPILDNLSSQILHTLGKGPFQDTLMIVTQPESDQGQAYGTLRALFSQTKKLYGNEAFLSADQLKLFDTTYRTTIRKVNLATFVSSVFGSTEVGFFHLNEFFLDTFVPEGGRLLKSQGGLFLDLKTQAYISAIEQGERSQEDILNDLFEEDLPTKLLDRRSGSKQLTPSEGDLVNRARSRREHLKEVPADSNFLREKYVWIDFLKELIFYVAKNQETILAPSSLRTKIRKTRTPPPMPPQMTSHVFQSQPQIQHSPSQHEMQNFHIPDEQDAVTAAAISAHHLEQAKHQEYMNAMNAMTQIDPSHSQIPPPMPIIQSAYSQEDVPMTYIGMTQTDDSALLGTSPNLALSFGAPPLAPAHPTQTTPTHILYEQARIAATARSLPNSRRAGLPSQRRPWSTEEEHALMAGLDRVKGPHWSQILAMFGAGGTISEALKDRNQVQLKDKARNLKLFFLKSGIEVPYYLQFVTGELKTRAPSQIARQERKKQQEETAKDDAAHVAAINILDGVGAHGEGEGEDEDYDEDGEEGDGEWQQDGMQGGVDAERAEVAAESQTEAPENATQRETQASVDPDLDTNSTIRETSAEVTEHSGFNLDDNLAASMEVDNTTDENPDVTIGGINNEETEQDNDDPEIEANASMDSGHENDMVIGTQATTEHDNVESNSGTTPDMQNTRLTEIQPLVEEVIHASTKEVTQSSAEDVTQPPLVEVPEPNPNGSPAIVEGDNSLTNQIPGLTMEAPPTVSTEATIETATSTEGGMLNEVYTL